MLEPLVGNILSSIPNLSDSYTLGLSGGIDSVVLLHLLVQIRASHTLKLSAIHVNHGISPNAGPWQDFCHNLCNRYGIPLTIIQGKISKSGGESLENNARNFRYQAFQNLPLTTITLAHHKNDQVETMLSQIFRGSDLHNVASMRALSQKKNLRIWRPLLNVSKAEIEAYATKFNLEHVNDESNLDKKYLRNFIRHEILPTLTKWDQNIASKLLNVVQQVQNSIDLIDEVAKSDLNSVLADNSNSKPILLINKFRTLSELRQINLLAYFINQVDLPLPSHKQLIEFNRQALNSSWDSMPSLSLNNLYKIIKTKDTICLASKP